MVILNLYGIPFHAVVVFRPEHDFLPHHTVFFVNINSFSNIFYLNRKILPCLKRKQKNCGFVDSGFLKTCHENYISVS